MFRFSCKLAFLYQLFVFQVGHWKSRKFWCCSKQTRRLWRRSAKKTKFWSKSVRM